MKKKSTSPTVALKQRTKQRILAKKGKPGGSSMTLPESGDASDSDVPPEGMLKNPVQAMHERIMRAAKVAVEDGSVLEDGTPFLTPEHIAEADRRHGTKYGPFTPLPVEHHGKTNDLARQTILSKVPTSKQDPNSDAATLARLNAAQQKPKKKGGQES